MTATAIIGVEPASAAMSALGPKQTWAVAPHVSAFGGRFGCSVGVVHHPAAQSYFNGLQELQKQHRSAVSRRTIFK
jgi:hypothetical protein